VRFQGKRWYLWLALLPIVSALVATSLFLSQGGFGGGHGRFDRTIGVLGLPAIVVMDATWLPGPLQDNDLVLDIWLPAVLNVALWLAVLASADRLVKLYRR